MPALPSSVTPTIATTPEPTCFLPSSARLFRSLMSMPLDRARHQLDVADHAHAVRSPPALAAAAHGELLLGVGELALELACARRAARRGAPACPRAALAISAAALLASWIVAFAALRAAVAGQRLDAAHAGGDAAVGRRRRSARCRRCAAHACRRTARPTSRAHCRRLRPSRPRAPRRRISRRTARARRTRRASSSAISRVVTGEFCSTKSLAMSSTFSISSARHRLGMREVEAQPVGRDQRALLRDVIAEHLAQRLVQQMRRRMIARGWSPRRA